MSRAQMFRALVSERLAAAGEDIFQDFEKTTVEYEEEISCLKEENSLQRKLLDAILKPEVRLQRADPQQLLACKEEDPSEQQEWSPSMGQEEPEIKEEHIKEEAEVPMLTKK